MLARDVEPGLCCAAKRAGLVLESSTHILDIPGVWTASSPALLKRKGVSVNAERRAASFFAKKTAKNPLLERPAALQRDDIRSIHEMDRLIV
jgi:hypothetical protein